MGVALFTIFVKGAGLYAPDWNRFAGKIELMMSKPVPLKPTRVWHPNSETPSSLNYQVIDQPIATWAFLGETKAN
jgi:hypothetical protein